MKVNEYLVHRILELEKDIKELREHIAMLEMYKRADRRLIEEHEKLINDKNDQLDDYEMEKEHIKQIITCNLRKGDDEHPDWIILNATENDFNTLLAILNIKKEDYDNKEAISYAETTD